MYAPIPPKINLAQRWAIPAEISQNIIEPTIHMIAVVIGIIGDKASNIPSSPTPVKEPIRAKIEENILAIKTPTRAPWITEKITINSNGSKMPRFSVSISSKVLRGSSRVPPSRSKKPVKPF